MDNPQVLGNWEGVTSGCLVVLSPLAPWFFECEGAILRFWFLPVGCSYLVGKKKLASNSARLSTRRSKRTWERFGDYLGRWIWATFYANL